MSDPRVFADARGVWRESTPGLTSGIKWEEVYKIGGHKLDGVTEVYTCVVLDFEFGEFIELYDCWPGFEQVITAITDRMPGLDRNWFEAVDRLSAADPPIEIWRRQ